MEAGIFNLTQEETPVLIHFGTDRTENWLLVRLNQQEEGSQASFQMGSEVSGQ